MRWYQSMSKALQLDIGIDWFCQVPSTALSASKVSVHYGRSVLLGMRCGECLCPGMAS